MKLKGLILNLGLVILAVLLNIHFNLSTIEWIFWFIAIVCINYGTMWEE